MDIFSTIYPDAAVVFATAAWQYPHHMLPGLRGQRGKILTVANWSGQWLGLAGLLNLSGSLVKCGTPCSTLWSKSVWSGIRYDGCGSASTAAAHG